MDRSTIKLETPESLVTDEIILDSAGNNLTDSAPCSSETNPEQATEWKQQSSMNNSVKPVMNVEVQNEKMGNGFIEPSLRMLSNLVVIAPQDENDGKCEVMRVNRRPYSPDHQEDINQDTTTPAVKQEMMDVVIKEETNEDVSMEEFDDKQAQQEIRSCEEHYIKLEEDINCLWADNLKETGQVEAQPGKKNEMSGDRSEDDITKSERIDGDLMDVQTSELTFSERVCNRRIHPGTSTVTCFDEEIDYDESCSLSFDAESDKEEKKINDNKSDAQSCAKSSENYSLTHYQCNELFKYPKNYAVVHVDKKPIICPVCQLGFQSMEGFSRHQSVHKRAKALSLSGERAFACEVCSRSFTHVVPFHNHMISHQNVKLSRCPDFDKVFHACTMCNERFNTQNQLQIHQTIHTVEKPYACTMCIEIFRTQYDLHVHQKIHPEMKHACTTCDKSFTTKYNLQDHQRTHRGEKPYACTMCNGRFRTQYDLRVHQKTHPKKPYACTTCDKSFSTKYILQRHQRIHTGEKPYACTRCDKSFITQQQFKVHQRTHTGKKPYACTTCGKRYSTLQGLNYHQRTHTGEM